MTEGGLGDKFMFARFIPNLCKKYERNKVTFFTNDNVKWVFDSILIRQNKFNDWSNVIEELKNKL